MGCVNSITKKEEPTTTPEKDTPAADAPATDTPVKEGTEEPGYPKESEAATAAE